MTTKDDEHSYERFVFKKADSKILRFVLTLSLLLTAVITTNAALSYLYPSFFLVTWYSIAFGGLVTFVLILFTGIQIVQHTTILMLESLDEIMEKKDNAT